MFFLRGVLGKVPSVLQKVCSFGSSSLERDQPSGEDAGDATDSCEGMVEATGGKIPVWVKGCKVPRGAPYVSYLARSVSGSPEASVHILNAVGSRPGSVLGDPACIWSAIYTLSD